MNHQHHLLSNHIEAQVLLDEWIPLYLDHNYKTARQTEIEQAFVRLGVTPDRVYGVWVLVPMAYTLSLDADEAVVCYEALAWRGSVLSASKPTPENEATIACLKRLLDRLMPQVRPEGVRE